MVRNGNVRLNGGVLSLMIGIINLKKLFLLISAGLGLWPCGDVFTWT